jgi:hypothetical protein
MLSAVSEREVMDNIEQKREDWRLRLRLRKKLKDGIKV